jgi:hypothetical protein
MSNTLSNSGRKAVSESEARWISAAVLKGQISLISVNSNKLLSQKEVFTKMMYKVLPKRSGNMTIKKS